MFAFIFACPLATFSMLETSNSLISDKQRQTRFPHQKGLVVSSRKLGASGSEGKECSQVVLEHFRFHAFNAQLNFRAGFKPQATGFYQPSQTPTS